MDTAKISIIVPVYKVEPYLRKCLDSIVSQTYENLEILLVDDGSPDSCGAICDEYAQKDPRVQVIHKENGGVSSARNAGLAAATGSWIGWVDPDDWVEPDMFAYLLENAEKYGADIAVCSRYEVYKNRRVFRGWECPVALNRQQGMELLLKNDELQNYCCDKLFRSELWEGITFPTGLTYEDIAVMHRLFTRSERVVCLPEAKYNYLQRSGSIVADTRMDNRWNYYLAARMRYEEIGNRWPELEPLLIAQCMASAIGIWCSYYANPKEERDRIRPRLEEISAFCRAHLAASRKHTSLGLAGRIVLRLTPYPRWWAFALAWLVSRMYERRHGRPL